MSFQILGILASSVAIILFSSLFQFEKRRGERFLHSIRTHLDSAVTHFENTVDSFFRHIGRDVIRQLIHFTFHTMLLVILKFLDTCRIRVQTLLRSNKSLAHKARSQNPTRNMFDEIAEHKVSVALTDKEKKKHKDKLLNG